MNETIKTNMAIGVDTSKWKPRQIRGTPAGVYRNYIAVGIISCGIVIGIIFHTSNLTQNLRKASEALYVDPVEEVERKRMIARGLIRSGDFIRTKMWEQSMPNRPDK